MIDWKIRALKAEAELQMLEKTEPVAWINLAASSKMFRFLAPTEEDGTVVKDWQQLFTHPMPAQRLTELKLLMLTTAYEQGVGKGIQRRDCNPYAADTDEHAAWKLGYEEGLDKPMPAESKDAERYRWLRDYLISPSTHFDDLIVSADKADTLNGVIDAARAKGAKQ